jgi:HAD superfamily hydrolase (TIGR01509 family)
MTASGGDVGAVVFDLDGVLVDSERVWDQQRERFARERGGRWHPDAQRDMMGMSSTEWSRYMNEELGVPVTPAEISADVAGRVAAAYRRDLPLFPGAVDAVHRLADRWRLGLASSANRPIIDLVLDLAGLARLFAVTISSEEVARGKPAPDVYLEATARLEVDPGRAVAIEDSTNGLLAARAAGLGVVALPNRSFPPAPDALDAADVVLDSLRALTPASIESAVNRRGSAASAPRARPG